MALVFARIFIDMSFPQTAEVEYQAIVAHLRPLPVSCTSLSSHHDARIARDTLDICQQKRNAVDRVVYTGHNSAASFPTGPVIADPFISPFGLTI